MSFVYVLLIIAAAAAAYWLLARKPRAQLPPSQSKQARDSSAAARAVRETTPQPVRRSDDAGADLRASSEPIADGHQQVAADEKVEREPQPSLPHVRDIDAIRGGLEKARGRDGIFGRLVAIFRGKRQVSAQIAAEIEEALIASDVGVQTTQSILERVNDRLTSAELVDSDLIWSALRDEARRILAVDGATGAFELKSKPTVVLMVGVNGAGKTTTIGKLATRLKAEGRSVILAAGDTFRAAAVQQLVVWGDRIGVEVVRGKDGADPGSVVFEAVKRASDVGADVVLADTAGRLHTKANLMSELVKVVKTTGKALQGAPHEVLLVIDATNGQNALAQAREFREALALTGIVLTKLDGTAKGGVILAICDALHLPVRFIGLGEKAADLHDFSPEDFVEALLGGNEQE